MERRRKERRSMTGRWEGGEIKREECKGERRKEKEIKSKEMEGGLRDGDNIKDRRMRNESEK